VAGWISFYRITPHPIPRPQGERELPIFFKFCSRQTERHPLPHEGEGWGEGAFLIKWATVKVAPTIVVKNSIHPFIIGLTPYADIVRPFRA